MQKMQVDGIALRMFAMKRFASLYARVSPSLTRLPGITRASRLHAWIHAKTRGRIGGRLLGADVLTLLTTGRRSGEPRESPVFFIKDAENYVVVASNAGSPRPPAWWLNLQADQDAQARVGRTLHRVRARLATDSEADRLWPRFVAMYSGYDYYRSIATRTLPVVVLEPR